MLGYALALLLAAQTDRTVDVSKGTRLEVHNFAGDVTIKVWNRDAVRVEAEHSDRDPVEIQAGDQVLVVRGGVRSGPTRSIDYTITVPGWMAITVEGRNADVTLDGVGSDVSVETVRGDILLRGGSGFVSLESVQGSITVDRASGRIEAHTLSDNINLTEITGEITAQSTNGDIVLDRVDTGHLEAYTVGGSISYDGPVKDKGSYRLTTHNGHVSMVVSDKANATLRVRTYGGSFRSTFPIKLGDQDRRDRFTLTLGDGSARVEVESFNGTIALRRPGEPRPRDGERDRNRPGPRPSPDPNPKGQD